MAATSQRAPDAQRGGVQVIARAATILRLLGDEGEGLSLTQLSAGAGLPRTTVHRICRALEQEGFVTTDAASGRLQLGPGPLQACQPQPARPADGHRPVPRAAVARAQRDGRPGRARRTRRCSSSPSIRRRTAASWPCPRSGARFPSHCTANGKALLAQLPEEEVARRLPKRLELPARGTSVSRDELLAELAEVRHSGLGFDREDHRAGICAVGVAITALDGSICSISVPMPAARFHEDEEKVVAALLRIARRDPGEAQRRRRLSPGYGRVRHPGAVRAQNERRAPHRAGGAPFW